MDLVGKNGISAEFKASLEQAVLPKEASNIVIETPALKVVESIYINGKEVSEHETITLRQLNDKYSHVVIGGKHRVASFSKCPVKKVKLRLETLSDFENNFLTKPPINKFNAGKAWLAWQGKNYCEDGLGYYPEPDRCPETMFNMFNGWGCDPIEGDVSEILSFIKDVLCGGEDVASNYFIHWLAHMVQRPMERPTVAVLLKGNVGTGSGTFDKLMQKIVGLNGISVAGNSQLTSRFQGVVVNKIYLFGDEVNLTNKYHADKMKPLITEPTASIEMKGYESQPVMLYARMVFAGNHESLISASERERRYLVISASESKMGDGEYWTMINKVINNGGAEAFFYYLFNLDISKFNPYDAPSTIGLRDEKIQNNDPATEFIYGHIRNGKPFTGKVRIKAEQLNSEYLEWYLENVPTATGKMKFNINGAASVMGKMMKKLGVEKSGGGRGGDPLWYEIKGCETLQKGFEKMLGEEFGSLF